MSRRSYGACPTQLTGFAADRRPFYFRSRHGQWTIHVGEVGWCANICAWPTYSNDQIAAYGPGDISDPDAVDAIVERVLGPDWRAATYEEQLFKSACSDCGRTFTSEGSNVCTTCLAALLGFGTND